MRLIRNFSLFLASLMFASFSYGSLMINTNVLKLREINALNDLGKDQVIRNPTDIATLIVMALKFKYGVTLPIEYVTRLALKNNHNKDINNVNFLTIKYILKDLGYHSDGFYLNNPIDLVSPSSTKQVIFTVDSNNIYHLVLLNDTYLVYEIYGINFIHAITWNDFLITYRGCKVLILM